MITPVRSRGICQSCRIDLQDLFERGFCSPTIVPKLRPTRTRRSPFQTRHFSSAPRAFALPDKKELDVIQEYRNALSDEDFVFATQVAAVEQLEDELANPTDQTITENETQQAFGSQKEKSQSQDVGVSKSASQRFVAALRDAGATPEDIIRGARQVYGDTLPHDTLNEEELTLYRRMYDEPVKEDKDEIQYTTDQNQLFSAEGEYIETGARIEPSSGNNENYSPITANDVDTSLTTARSREVAKIVGGAMEVDMDEDEYDEEYDEEFPGPERGHPLTRIGKFRTEPKTVFLSQEGYVKPIEKTMSDYSNKHLREMCERTFGGPGLPDSPLTPRSGRARQQVPIPLSATQNTMGEMEANAFVTAVMPPTYASVTSVLVETRRRLGPTWLNKVLAREGGPRVLDAGAGGVGIVAWREIVQAHWNSLHSSDKDTPPPPSTKSVVVTASDGLRHRAADMLDNTTFIPRLPDYVHTRNVPTLEDNRPSQQRKQFDVIIAPHMLFQIKQDWERKQYVQNLWSMLSSDGGVLILIEKGIPRGFEAIAGARDMLLDRYISIPEGHTTYYSNSHTQQEDDEGIHRKERGMIIAPCTNHERCPMYTAPGLSRGRKDICSFSQRYIRPPFLQRVLGAKDRNHDDVNFSYLSVMKGDDLRLRELTSLEHIADPLSAPIHPNIPELFERQQSLIRESKEGFEHVASEVEDESGALQTELSTTEPLPGFNTLPRIILPSIKRRGHVSIDLCTPAGRIERWTIPKSFSKQAYRDARKSRWGDLWALGAKTHIARNLRLGTPEKEMFGKDGEVIPGKGRGRKERLKIKAMQMLDKQEEEKMDELMEQRDLMAALDEAWESDPSVPQDIPLRSKSTTAVKPMNNRDRKAARKVQREPGVKQSSPQAGTNDADLTFKPRTRQTESFEDSLAMEHAMAEWKDEYERVFEGAKGKGKGGLGNTSHGGKSARRVRKVQNRSRDDDGDD